MGWNVLVEVSSLKDFKSFAIYEEFVDWYKYWGYVIEGTFRISGILIAWRCYQYSRLGAD